MPNKEICKAAEAFEQSLFETSASIICRQKHINLLDVVIDCVPSEKVAERMEYLASLGYNDGPSESSSFGVVDGEEIVLKFESNIHLKKSETSTMILKFYNNLEISRCSGHLDVVDKNDQKEEERYYGYRTYKTLNELVDTFPFTMSTQGTFSDVYLQRISFALVEKWDKLAKQLGFHADQISEIKSRHSYEVVQSMRMLNQYRLSDSAIRKGTELVQSFHESAKASKVGEWLINLVADSM